ncbi:uncharacterized protein AMSG_12338 [Thecamonas trahens ATCC 50062]|uniref:Peptidase A1 domain-containing protein n=1 Tax=Thecamonas trahens ATCC 50062 TaxID=461836 RepID=A0A0L0DPR5_THETB|nr:hypothetical protein AMSG_12338 [Thecamonas trahens ATCC 50062]KNC54299.1 hypothetical protein AMSG_12338 [Thecamonas trahens ATCC 50062]|eukprot:XP_013753821.1 hypothetical protein AMSG_12338 [Thecamonas trahens ATCC 50062]
MGIPKQTLGAIVLGLVMCMAFASIASAGGVVKHHVHKSKRSTEAKDLLPGHRALLASHGKALEQGVGGSIWPVSIFWTNVEIGSPPVFFPVAIDSGSFTLNVPLAGCHGCITKPPNKAYDPSASSSSAPLACPSHTCDGIMSSSCAHTSAGDVCSFSNTYETCKPTDPTAPCTIKGPWYSDKVALAGSAATTVLVGAIDYQTEGFYQFETVDGVMGMAGPPAETSVFSQLVNAGALPADVWSLCLRPNGGRSNGTIVFGGVDDDLFHGELQWTPNAASGPYAPFYVMAVDAMTVGGKPLTGVLPTVIIDTGTNDLLLNDKAFASFKQSLLDMCATTNLTGMCNVPEGQTLFDGKCFDLSPADVAAYPDFVLEVPGISLVISPPQYLLANFGSIGKPGQTCLAVSPTGPNGLVIVGDTLLVRYTIVFDRANHRIGWAPVNVDTCVSMALRMRLEVVAAVAVAMLALCSQVTPAEGASSNSNGSSNNGTHLVVYIAEQPPFVYQVVDSSGSVRYEGFDIDLWNRVFTRLQLSGDAESFEYQLIDKSDVVEAVESAAVAEAVGVASVAIDPALLSRVKFSHVYFHSGLDAIVLRRNTQVNIFLFTAPFTFWLWASASVLLFFSGFVIWFFEREYQPRLFPRSLLSGVNEGVWYCFSVLVKAQTRDLRGFPTRMYSVAWSYLTIVFVAAYTANLASILIVEQLRSDINDASQLNGEIIGVVNGTDGVGWVGQNLPAATTVVFPSVVAGFTALTSDVVGALFFDSPTLWYLKNTRDFDDRYDILGERLSSDRFAMVLKSNSSLVDTINGAIISTFEDGFLEDLRKVWFGQRFKSLLPSGVEEMSFISVSGLYVPMGLAVVAAIVSYVVIRFNPGLFKR